MIPPSALCEGNAEGVILSNKIGAFFSLRVPRSLTLSSLIFDSLDFEATDLDSSLDLCSSLR